MNTSQRAGTMATDLPGTDSRSNSVDTAESSTDSIIATLREENASLRQQLTLRDHALDATSTLFVMTEVKTPEPVIVYCNRAVAEQHGFAKQELIGKPLSFLAQWIGDRKS